MTEKLNEFFWPWLFNPINNLLFQPDPRRMLTLTFIIFLACCVFMKKLTHPIVAGIPAALMILIFLVGLVNPDFQLVIFKADNVPIIIMLLSVGFFTWWGLRQAVLNDEYKEKASKDLLKVSNTVNNDPEDKVHTFPFLVHPEFISAIICGAFLTLWSVALNAPIEQPADPARTPNPSKAPWYFLGLQEMLVYFDPWMAGVVLPSYIVIGLMAIPYFDANKKGNGYYTWKERKYAISMFMFGFLVLWVVLIVLGTMMRGPGWNFFGPFQYWDHLKVEALTSMNLSEIISAQVPGMHWITPTTPWFVREAAGFAFLGFFFFVLPVAGWFGFKSLAKEYGVLRYTVASHLVLMMMILPVKMYLRWLLNLKYILWIPEIGINL